MLLMIREFRVLEHASALHTAFLRKQNGSTPSADTPTPTRKKRSDEVKLSREIGE
jgi:hypothetical protein